MSWANREWVERCTRDWDVRRTNGTGTGIVQNQKELQEEVKGGEGVTANKMHNNMQEDCCHRSSGGGSGEAT